MSDIYKGELQDYEGNTIYPHSEADVIFCTDGETAQSKLNKYEEALGNVTGVTDSLEVDDSKILASAKALHKVNSSLESQPTFEYDSTGKITGYKTKAGADTVFPFSSGANGTLTIDYAFSMTMNVNDGGVGLASGRITVTLTDGAITNHTITGSGSAMTVGARNEAGVCSASNFIITGISWTPQL